MDQRMNRDVGTAAAALSSRSTTGTPKATTSNPIPVESSSTIQQSSLRRSSRSNKFSGSYYYSGAGAGAATSNHVESTIQQQEQDPPSNFKRKMEGHPLPPFIDDPEMLSVWFPPRDKHKHVDIKKIRRTNNPNAGFSAKTLAAYAAKCASMVPASIIQKIRHQDALLFPTWYKYDETNDDEMKDKKTRICSAGVCSHGQILTLADTLNLNSEQSSGIPWVAVHGVDQICMVTIGAYEVARRRSLLTSDFGLHVLMRLTDKVVTEMEAIESHQLIDQSLKKGPFAVVSVVRNPDQQGSSSKVSLIATDAEKCIKFLVDKLQDASYFSYDETVKTAISAMRCLFCNKLKFHDVLVSVMRKSDGGPELLSYFDSKEMWLLSD